MARKLNTKERVSFANSTEKERNELAKMYLPLVNKIVAQLRPTQMNYDDVFSMGLEGLADAINDFDPERSQMKFTQYAAFAIRNKILLKMTEESNVVKLNAYTRNQIIESGGSAFLNIRMEKVSGEKEGKDDATYSREYKYGLYTEPKSDDPIAVLIEWVKERYDERRQEYFFTYFKLGKYDNDNKMIDLAKKYGVTNGSISSAVKRIINDIKADKRLVEVLEEIVKQ